jgi:hypothetical protein
MPHIVKMQFYSMSQQGQHHSRTGVVACETHIEFYIDYISSAISIELHGFVFGNRPADIPKDVPEISSPRIGYTEV